MKKRNKTLVFGILLLATGLGVSLISMDFKPNNVELSSTNKDLLAFYLEGAGSAENPYVLSTGQF